MLHVHRDTHTRFHFPLFPLSHSTHFALLLLRGRGNAGKVLDDLLGVLCLSSTRLTTVIEEEKGGEEEEKEKACKTSLLLKRLKAYVTKDRLVITICESSRPESQTDRKEGYYCSLQSLTLQHISVCIVSYSEDVRRHFCTSLPLVHMHNLVCVDGQGLIATQNSPE